MLLGVYVSEDERLEIGLGVHNTKAASSSRDSVRTGQSQSDADEIGRMIYGAVLKLLLAFEQWGELYFTPKTNSSSIKGEVHNPDDGTWLTCSQNPGLDNLSLPNQRWKVPQERTSCSVPSLAISRYGQCQ
jgi:hypothetical protein